MSDLISTYWATIGITPVKVAVKDKETSEPSEADRNSDVRKSALSRAHEIRKFEIELYWKRATYFWILQAAVFTAIGLIWKADNTEMPPVLTVALAALGAIASLAGWLSAKGSKFWQENWEHHIDMLEDEFEGRLHKTVYVGEDGIAWSVSGVNDRLAVCFGVFWSGLLATTVLRVNPIWKKILLDCLSGISSTNILTILILLVTGTAATLLWLRKTNFKSARAIPYRPGTEAAGDADKDFAPEVLAKLRKPFLIRREPKT